MVINHEKNGKLLIFIILNDKTVLNSILILKDNNKAITNLNSKNLSPINIQRNHHL